MTDSIFMKAMEFEGHHGVSDEERADSQVIEMDIEYELDLQPAGSSDDLAKTVSYSDIFQICRAQAQDHSYHLLEALGEAVAHDVLEHDKRIDRVAVTVRKPGVPIDGVLEYAGVRLERARS